jgi:dolichol-phosphate mannosyltransferase
MTTQVLNPLKKSAAVAPPRGASCELALGVIVPVLNERGNVRALLDMLAAALDGIVHEVIFVDDGSTDGTQAEVESIARTDRAVRLIRRHGRRGLSSAVVEGMCSSVAPVLAVIDGDLQHDETILPEMLHAISGGGSELAVGTRYAGEGSVGDWDAKRVSISRFATRLAAPVMKTPLSDPMSGFFAIRRDVLLDIVPRLSTVGYKILLDIVASSPKRLRLTEIPYQFRSRVAGESKLDSAVALEYIELLLEKMIGRWIPPKLIFFGIIGSLGAVIHLGILGTLVNGFGARFAIGQTIAVATAMLFNFTLNNNFTYRDRRLKGMRWFTGFISFALLCSVGAIANVGIGSMLYAREGGSWWLAGLAGIAVGSVWNYAATNWLTWRRK